MELKPCPFCGLQPNKEHISEGMGEYWVLCPDYIHCGGTTRACGTKESAIEAWNRRVESNSPKADKEED